MAEQTYYIGHVDSKFPRCPIGPPAKIKAVKLRILQVNRGPIDGVQIILLVKRAKSLLPVEHLLSFECDPDKTDEWMNVFKNTKDVSMCINRKNCTAYAYNNLHIKCNEFLDRN